MKIVYLFLASLLMALPAYATVLETNEWNNVTQTGWIYSSGWCACGAAYDATPTGGSSPGSTGVAGSGGGALRMQWNSGTYATSVAGGRAVYTLAGKTELYVGHWYKASSGFTWNPVGTKIDYLYTAGTAPAGGFDNFLLMTHFQGSNALTFTQQLNGSPGTQNRTSNIANVSINSGTWYWIEYHAKMNDVGSANGIIEAWIDDTLVMQHSNVTFRTWNTTWGDMQHSPEWGGGGGTISSTQYVWFDHTVISTTRIGRPGGPPVIVTDTTAPTPPTAATVE